MKYMILDINYDLDLVKQDIQCRIRGICAILLDEMLHTKDKYIFPGIGNNRFGTTSEETFEAWKGFKNRMDEEAILITWNDRYKQLINRMDCITGNYKTVKEPVLLERLFRSMILCPESSISINKALEILGLGNAGLNERQPEECAKKMVRIFRKLYKAGVGVMDNRFIYDLAGVDYTDISGREFFPEINRKMDRMRDKEITVFFKDTGMECRCSDCKVYISGSIADYYADLMDEPIEVTYNTRKFYKGDRRFLLQVSESDAYMKRVKMLRKQIAKIENRFMTGIGNAEITGFVEKIGNKL